MVWCCCFKCQKDCLIALPFLRGNSKVHSSKKVGFAFALKITELLELRSREEETVVESQVAESVWQGGPKLGFYRREPLWMRIVPNGV